MTKQKTALKYEEGKNALSAILTRPITTPLQTVVPITSTPTVVPDQATSTIIPKGEKQTKLENEKKENPHEGLKHVNFWTEQELFDRLKIYAALNRMTIREIVTEALDQYLK